MPRTPDPGALQYDLRADHVTRRRQPASRAFMPTLRKRLGHGRSAYAHLAGSTRIHLHQLSPGARSLVPEFGKERVPSGVVDRAGQYSARKSFDVQVFHPDQPVAFHQPTAEIMMKGGTLVSDFTVRLGHQCGGLAAAVAAALATGKPALGAAQVCQPALEVSRIVDLLAIRKCDKAIQSDIHADLFGRLRQRHTVPLDGKTHVPVVHVPLDRNGLDLTLHRPVQLHFDATSALDTQLPVIEQSAAIAVGWKGDTVVPPERTEAREARLLAASYANEERLEGLIQPAEHILAAGEVGQSEQPFFPHRLQLLGLVVVVDALAANFPSIAPFLKGGVVELASLVELVLEKPSLGLVGVQAVFVGGAHKQMGVYKEHRPKANKKRRRTNMQKKAAFPCHLKATVPCGRVYGCGNHEPISSVERRRLAGQRCGLRRCHFADSRNGKTDKRQTEGGLLAARLKSPKRELH